ncbi:hypothetical protein CspeluHIS016_0212010 [Cutaneotrichosporon spelunceum]|uniref:Uncharacterized protein n=1 Tax=Cutaneotrichosporon spelunceum TaxID=1672016 RepID=A0AAD3TSQ3_9TREE|nr:hypothetical protein CspeluHIS016_0212010 [Cutaneotrichosporon spelunceum]
MSTTAIQSKEEKETGNVLYQVSSIEEKGLGDDTPPTRDLWGDLDDDGPKYRNLGWIRATILMTKYQVGLGVRTFFTRSVIAPGCILLTVVAAAATWPDYVVGVFKMAYPEVYSIPDICTLMWGQRIGDV